MDSPYMLHALLAERRDIVLKTATDAVPVHTIDAERRTIRDIFGISRTLAVPLYQRSFAWTKSEVDELWEDLQGVLNGDDNSYFLGPMVFVQRGATTFEVVDGQQRLAALSLLFAVIRDGYRQADRQAKAEIIESNALLQQKDLRSEKAAPKLSLNETDNDVFIQIVEGKQDDDYYKRILQDHKADESSKLLISAYLSYRGRISERSEGFSDVDALNDLAEALLDRIAVIEIITTDEDAAYTLFETLNDRGADLTLSDLLKNFLFGRAKSRLAEVRKLWTEVMTTVGQGTMTQFIRHEWMSRNGKIREPVLFRRLKERIKTPSEVMEYVGGLRKAADVYAALSNPSSPVWKGYSSAAKELLKQVGVFKVVQCYPLLMSAKLQRRPHDFEVIARWIVGLTVRYSIIGGKGTGNLETAYANASPICRDKGKTLGDVKKPLLNIYPGDEEFRTSFASKRQSEEPIARLILAELEKALSQARENVPSDSLTLEHILPRNPGAAWPASLRSTALHGVLVNRIGNLTLMVGDGRDGNSSLPDGFEEKTPVYAKSKLAITSQLASYREWNEATIDARQQQLASAAVKVWFI